MFDNPFEAIGWERAEAYWRDAAVRPETGERLVGVIGIRLPDLLSSQIATDRAEEPNLWQIWLDRTFRGDGETVLYGGRFGRHLWMYAAVPHLPPGHAGRHLDRLAGRLRDRLQEETAGWAAAGSEGFGVGTAVAAVGPDRPIREALYAGVLEAAQQLADDPRDARHAALRREMERILREGAIRSVYQPILRLEDGRIFGYEALTRCPDGCPFDGPLALFKFADQEGHAFALDRLARATAIRSCPELGDGQKIFLNVNAGIMSDPHFISGQTVGWLAEKGLRPGQVVFELTERSSIEDFEEAKKVLHHYRRQGYEIAIDDAGAGYSSLQSIVELQPDYIKVDRSLVQNADRNEMKKQMLRTFVRFAKRMRIRTIAEGIERAEELKLVRGIGMDYGQGYLIGRPSERPFGFDPSDRTMAK